MESQLNHLEDAGDSSIVGSSASLVSKGIHYLTINNALAPIITIVRDGICGMFSKIQIGTLKVVFSDGEYRVYGTPDTGYDVTLTIIKDQFWMRVAIYSDLGFAEAYMNSECEVSNRTEFLQLLNQNRKFIEGSKTYTRKIMMGLNYFINTKFANSISNSINNISAHYDLGNDMFQLFLDPSMTYSCPIWDLNDPDDDLHKAQLRKLHNVIRKAKIVESDHVLEIGSGWGSFAMEAVKLTGCKVTTLTLSIEQKALADRRIREAGLSDRITVKLCDYRNLSTDFKFDKIVSIEMIEAVGKEYLGTYFETCHNLLKEDGGLMVLQAITIHENRYDRYSNQVDFIQKYIFPGGHLPSITMLISSIHSGTKGMLITNNLEDIGAHYAKALRLWCENFTASYPLISKGNPEKYNTVFKRCWQYYFNYCETGFREHLLGTVQIVLTRPKNKAVVQGVPL